MRLLFHLALLSFRFPSLPLASLSFPSPSLPFPSLSFSFLPYIIIFSRWWWWWWRRFSITQHCASIAQQRAYTARQPRRSHQPGKEGMLYFSCLLASALCFCFCLYFSALLVLFHWASASLLSLSLPSLLLFACLSFLLLNERKKIPIASLFSLACSAWRGYL